MHRIGCLRSGALGPGRTLCWEARAALEDSQGYFEHGSIKLVYNIFTKLTREFELKLRTAVKECA